MGTRINILGDVEHGKTRVSVERAPIVYTFRTLVLLYLLVRGMSSGKELMFVVALEILASFTEKETCFIE